MWDALPDVFSPEWFAAVRDVLSVGLAALGTYLAGLAIKMGRANEKVTRKQVEILEKLEELEGKQAEIAEKQHDFTRAEAAKAAKLEAFCWGIGREQDGSTHKFAFDVRLRNSGSREARDIHWKVRISKTFTGVVIRGCTGNHWLGSEEAIDITEQRGLEGFQETTGRYEGPVYPGQEVPFLKVDQQLPEPVVRPVADACLVVLDCQDGRFPATGFAKVRLWSEPPVDNSGQSD